MKGFLNLFFFFSLFHCSVSLFGLKTKCNYLFPFLLLFFFANIDRCVTILFSCVQDFHHYFFFHFCLWLFSISLCILYCLYLSFSFVCCVFFDHTIICFWLLSFLFEHLFRVYAEVDTSCNLFSFISFSNFRLYEDATSCLASNMCLCVCVCLLSPCLQRAASWNPWISP